ncbi:hypothetical protein FRC00_006681 [Tulasnella sp. 408]|nr:hypothetical protein FRC00_006681 [Tulasnella sp. 408]
MADEDFLVRINISTKSLPKVDSPPKTENIPAPPPPPAPGLATISNITTTVSVLNLNETTTGIIWVDCPGSEAMYILSFLLRVYENMVLTTRRDKLKALTVENCQESTIREKSNYRTFRTIASF